ncbi:hypothetical protein F5882DRAFT_387081 [Hyaloscypha sp. PMI_1271]|nr:hypothetical protein F5882DRAFT_387081 [Hyaloscypha sp. PMI_1271]
MSYFDSESVKEVLDIDRSNLDPDKDIPIILKDIPPIKANIPPIKANISPIKVNDLALIVPARKALLYEGKTLNLKRSSNIKALIKYGLSTRYSLNLVSRVIATTTTTNPFTLGPLLAPPTNKGKVISINIGLRYLIQRISKGFRRLRERSGAPFI